MGENQKTIQKFMRLICNNYLIYFNMILDTNQSNFEISGVGEQDEVSLINDFGQKVHINIKKKILSEKAIIYIDSLEKGEYVLVINGVRLQKIILN